MAVKNKSSYRFICRDEVVLSKLKSGHSYLTHSYLLKGSHPGMCYVSLPSNYQLYIGRVY